MCLLQCVLQCVAGTRRVVICRHLSVALCVAVCCRDEMCRDMSSSVVMSFDTPHVSRHLPCQHVLTSVSPYANCPSCTRARSRAKSCEREGTDRRGRDRDRGEQRRASASARQRERRGERGQRASATLLCVFYLSVFRSVCLSFVLSPADLTVLQIVWPGRTSI